MVSSKNTSFPAFGSDNFLMWAHRVYERYGDTNFVSFNPAEINYLFWEVKRHWETRENGDEFSPSLFKQAGLLIVKVSKEQLFENPLVKYKGIQSIDNHQNIFIALSFALEVISGSSVLLSDGRRTNISEDLWLSQHSWIDIVDAISEMIQSSGAHSDRCACMVAVLIEQIVYKSNPNLQYGYTK